MDSARPGGRRARAGAARAHSSGSRPIFYDCGNCPSYCCTYPQIVVDEADIARLARHVGLDVETARRRFTKAGADAGATVLRHVRDPIFGTACRFLDLDARTCTVHEARPDVCRNTPPSSSCHYYAFLMAERRYQGKPTLKVTAFNRT